MGDSQDWRSDFSHLLCRFLTNCAQSHQALHCAKENQKTKIQKRGPSGPRFLLKERPRIARALRWARRSPKLGACPGCGAWEQPQTCRFDFRSWLDSARHPELVEGPSRATVEGRSARPGLSRGQDPRNVLTTGSKYTRLVLWSRWESAKKAERRGGTRVPLGKAWAGRQSSWARAKGLPLPPRTFRVARCFSRRARSA